jgi:hypothetical protein
MEEEYIIDFSDIILPKTEYVAVFDQLTGEVTAVGPLYGFPDEPNKIIIDDDIALSILEGKIHLSSCIVNVHDETFQISEIKSLFKIDDLLHRIIDSRFTEIEDIDILIVFCKEKNQITLKMSENLGGTLSSSNKKNKSIFWKGDTTMYFFITDYNDPNVLYETITVNLDQLIGQDYVYKLNSTLEDFSLYTRRLFKNYLIKQE